MALSQMDLIRSLGEALAWLQREIAWGVPPTELRHLCGRIGELYAAMITNGQMALEVNQIGYDVVSAQGERVSVKTTAMTGFNGHVAFNGNSLRQVDRVIVLRINTEEMQVETLLDAPVGDAIAMMSPESSGKRALPLYRLRKDSKPRGQIMSVKETLFEGYVVRELENGSIEVEKENQKLSPVRPVLRELAARLNLNLLNSNGNPLNTRQLGTLVIRSAQERREPQAENAVDAANLE